ncbi:MFS family permease [Catalinimonas alkaloidigena]|uniref:MFS transporter n=1 Tax=Catalinimonas alkaloidigena TaxID=1075417 RepID=UPI002406CFAA|nr:MFS transporter [Catalinimonas alkaloidigena]MDF9798714.1 MFS family permease [Catalinimonas alkaloidigena]
MSSNVAKKPPSVNVSRMAVGAFFIILGIIFSTWASRIPNIQGHLQLSDGAWGSVLFALPFGLLTGLPLSAWAVARLGSQRTMLAATLFHIFTLPFIGLANESWVLMSILFFFGLSGNLINVAVNTQAVAVEALYKRSIMASFHGLWSLAGFAGAALGALFISLGLSPFIHFCIIGGLVCILLVFAYRHTLADENTEQKQQKVFVMPDRQLLVLGMIAFCGMICEGTMFDWSGIYFKKVVEVPEAYIAVGYVAFMCSMAAARFIGDRLAGKFGTFRMIQLNGLLVTIGLLISVAFPNIVSATLGFMLVGLGVSTIVPLLYGETGKTTTMSPGSAITAVSSVGFLGFLFGPPVIGYISEITDLRWAFALVSLLGISIVLISSSVKKIQ